MCAPAGLADATDAGTLHRGVELLLADELVVQVARLSRAREDEPVRVGLAELAERKFPTIRTWPWDAIEQYVYRGKTPREIADYKAALYRLGRGLGFWGQRLQFVHDYVGGDEAIRRPAHLVWAPPGPAGSVASYDARHGGRQP